MYRIRTRVSVSKRRHLSADSLDALLNMIRDAREADPCMEAFARPVEWVTLDGDRVAKLSPNGKLWDLGGSNIGSVQRDGHAV